MRRGDGESRAVLFDGFGIAAFVSESSAEVRSGLKILGLRKQAGRVCGKGSIEIALAMSVDGGQARGRLSVERSVKSQEQKWESFGPSLIRHCVTRILPDFEMRVP